MAENLKINRLEYMILKTLYSLKCKDFYTSMTISEMMEYHADESGRCALGVRMTIYKKLQKLVNASYISKGVIDTHADTYYLMEKGIRLIEKGGNV